MSDANTNEQPELPRCTDGKHDLKHYTDELTGEEFRGCLKCGISVTAYQAPPFQTARVYFVERVKRLLRCRALTATIFSDSAKDLLKQVIVDGHLRELRMTAAALYGNQLAVELEALMLLHEAPRDCDAEEVVAEIRGAPR